LTHSDALLAPVLAITCVCPSVRLVCLSQVGSFIETNGRIRLVFAVVASIDLSYTVF